jgi:ferredoxin-NADP reductase
VKGDSTSADRFDEWRLKAAVRFPTTTRRRNTALSASRRNWSSRARSRRISCASPALGSSVRLGGVEGAFTLPDPLPAKLLFISAGSGITPIMTMLRSIDHGDGPTDAVHLHSARADRDVLFATQLRELQQRNSGFRPHLRLTGENGRMSPADLDRLCSDWRERETFLC